MAGAEADPRIAKVAFARLFGDEVDCYMRKYELVLGRRSKSTALDVCLGETRPPPPWLEAQPLRCGSFSCFYALCIQGKV